MDNVIISIAEKSDIKDILDIYGYYVLNSPATFEIEIPDINEFSLRVENIQKKYPYLTAKINGKMAGFAYAAPLRTRKAYDYSCETTIYLHHEYLNKSIGTKLYTALFDYIKKQNILNIYACITYANTESVLFHKKFGFEVAAHFHNCGYKHNTWHDILWLEKIIGNHTIPPAPFINFNDLKL